MMVEKICLQFWWQSTARLWEEQSVCGGRSAFEARGCLSLYPGGEMSI